MGLPDEQNKKGYGGWNEKLPVYGDESCDICTKNNVNNYAICKKNIWNKRRYWQSLWIVLYSKYR